MPVKEKLVKILAPGVGWIEMAAQNRRRNDTSRHAVGVWEEFSFLDKGSNKLGGRERRARFALRFLFFSLLFSGSGFGFGWIFCLPFENGNQIIWRNS